MNASSQVGKDDQQVKKLNLIGSKKFESIETVYNTLITCSELLQVPFNIFM
jgi:hypothetical protein